MRGDDQNVVTSGRGRNSVRIASTKAYRDSVIVMDIEHMPYGCAQWPAFWTLTNGNWPDGGEIDMLEGTYHSYTVALRRNIPYTDIIRYQHAFA